MKLSYTAINMGRERVVEKIKICPAKQWCPLQVDRKYYMECRKKGKCKLEIIKLA